MKVMVVEDDADVRDLVREALKADGFSVDDHALGRDALEAVDAVRPDLMLLDVMMPDIDGVALAHVLRERPLTADVAIVFMTACLRPEDIARYAALGALDVIAKPLDPRTLGARLHTAFAARAAGQLRTDASLGGMGRGYRTELPDRVRDIERLTRVPALTAADAKQAALLAHRLARSAAIFGMDDVSGAARALEDALGRFLIEDAAAAGRSIETLLGALCRSAAQIAAVAG